MSEKKNKIVVIFGTSGSGQDSVIKGLIDSGLRAERVITTVSRPMRPSESQGKPYYFISEEEFKKLIEDDKLIEWDHHYSGYYGCTYEEYERVSKLPKAILWKTDMRGAVTIKEKFPQVFTIYVKPPSLEIALERLRKRGQETEEVIQKRAKEIREYLNPENDEKFDFVVVNEEGKLNETVEEVKGIIEKELR